MRSELTDNEWTAIGPMLSNKPRGVPRVNDRRVRNRIFRLFAIRVPCHMLRTTALGRRHVQVRHHPLRPQSHLRLMLQQAEGISAGTDLLRTTMVQEPLSEVAHRAKPLNPEAQELVERPPAAQ